MHAKEIQAIQPTYFDRFSCIGPLCTDNCCHSWEIMIDKEHYHRYIKESNPEFRQICLNTVRKLRHNASPDRFASLALKEDGRCGFQDEDGGCRIYRLLGPNALSCTCAIYPRRKAMFLPNVWELSLSLSCEEAAKLALFSPSGLDFVSVPHPIRPDNPFDASVPLGIGENGEFVQPPKYGIMLRQTCMELIRFPQLTIAERILAIGLLLRKIDQLLSSRNPHQISAMSAFFLMSVKNGEFKGFFERLDYQQQAHLTAMELPIAHLFAGARKPVLRSLWSILEPWCDMDASGEYIAGRRAAAHLLQETQKYAVPFISRHPMTIENYFSSYMFSSMFPFLYHNKGLSFEKHGILLAEQYSLLKILLAAYSEITDEEERLIRAVVMLSRLCQHADLGQDMEKLLQTVHLDGLSHASYLLR